MRSIVKILATTLFGVAIAGTPILAQTVTIDYDHSVNFLKLKTFTWTRCTRPTRPLKTALPSPRTAIWQADICPLPGRGEM